MGIFAGVELEDLVLTGDRVTVRPWTPGDAADVVRALADDRIHRFISLPKPYTPADAEAFLSGPGVAGRRAGTGVGGAIVESATGRLVGSVDLRLGEAPDIGYWIAPDAQGAGYAAAATRLLAEWGFGVGIARIEISCDVANLASARTAMTAGFRFEGVRRGALSWADGGHDLAVFGRLATDPGAAIRPALPPLPSSGLSDGTIALRVLERTDLTRLIEQEADPLTIANGFTGSPLPPADLERHAARAALEWLVGLGASFAVIDCRSGRFAGTLRVRTNGPPQIGGIGYALHPDFRGRGYTTRALRLVAQWAFTHADFARLELGAKLSNVASQRAALAAGFEPDGTMTARLRSPDGTFSDEARFALVNPRHRPAQDPSTSLISP